MKIDEKGLIAVSSEEAAIMYKNKITAGSCGGITMPAGYSCVTPLAAGVVSRLLLVDKDVWDLATVTYDVTTTTLITDIVPAGTYPSTEFYVFQGIRRSIRPQSAFVPAAYTVGYDHQVEFQIFDITQEQKDNIEQFGLSKMVAIVENINAAGNGNSVFEVFGKDVGMEIQGGALRINDDIETNGSYSINLKTADDGGKEPKLPTSIWDTDFDTTKFLIYNVVADATP